ncbi:hypothetical protein QBC32DRAFT_218592, partial [Pseudoneurospora amorphoporcata]
KDIHSFAVSEYNIVTTVVHSGHREIERSPVQSGCIVQTLPLPTKKAFEATLHRVRSLTHGCISSTLRNTSVLTNTMNPSPSVF